MAYGISTRLISSPKAAKPLLFLLPLHQSLPQDIKETVSTLALEDATASGPSSSTWALFSQTSEWPIPSLHGKVT